MSAGAERFDVIVIGAGAAGLMAAAIAGSRGRRVVVLEHTAGVGAKILISGGGRCNFTNRYAAPAHFLSQNPAFARSALARYTPADFIALVERHGVAHYEKTLGQLFCEGAGAARKIVALLMAEAGAQGVAVRTACAVRAVTHGAGFRVDTDLGVFAAPALIVATGGLSIPKLGASDFAFRLAGQFGVPVIAPRPGLVPLTLAGQDLAASGGLSGVAAAVEARAGAAAFREAALFTHRGLSGPAILQISSYWREGDPIALDFAPDEDEDFLIRAKRVRPGQSLAAALAAHTPARLAHLLAGAQAAAALRDLKDAALREAARRAKAWSLIPAGTEGYAKAEVTLGGIDTRALDQKTMAVRAIPGLYFIGEAVDVTGWLGGYNFQWAWASGYSAGVAA